MFTENDNPYQAPAASGKGKYDWTLAKRVFLAVSMLTIFYLLCSGVGAWNEFRHINPNRTNVKNQLVDFFTGWNTPPAEAR